jgi:hypothetical protein
MSNKVVFTLLGIALVTCWALVVKFVGSIA